MPYRAKPIKPVAQHRGKGHEQAKQAWPTIAVNGARTGVSVAQLRSDDTVISQQMPDHGGPDRAAPQTERQPQQPGRGRRHRLQQTK